MKIVLSAFTLSTLLLSSSTTTTVDALQGNYLSQLAGPATATTSTGTDTSTSSFFPAPSTTVGQTGGMESLYSTGPPGSSTASSNDGIAPAFGLSQSSPSSPSFGVAPPAAAGGAVVTPSAQLLEAWSAQVSVELSASQLYLSASIWCKSHGYPGMAAWMYEESGEERGHGLAILDWALQQGWADHIVLEPLDAPKRDWSNVVEVWESILLAEQTNTQNLLRLASYADACGDYGSQAMLNPFHVEQIEAEDKVGSYLHKISMASPEFLVEIDHQLAMEAEEEANEHH